MAKTSASVKERNRSVVKTICLSFSIITPVLMVVASFYIYNILMKIPDMPDLDMNLWWGVNESSSFEDTSIRPYRVVFTQSMQQVLHQKFETRRRRPAVQSFNGTKFTYGFNSKALAEVFEYWMFQYRIRDRERYFNRYNHFLTNINGLDIHFVRIRPDVKDNVKVYPILLLHGWPGSIKEFYEVIPHLVNNRPEYDFAFDIIAPSLPGFGYSQAAVRPGLSPHQIAIIMHKLMQRIGFEHYYVQGGDLGHAIATHMATIFPEHILGFHTNFVVNLDRRAIALYILGALWPSLIVEKEYEGRMYPLTDKLSFMLEEGGYMHMHMTKPDTIGASLQDSPLGLAAYILEKFVLFTDPSMVTEDGGLAPRYSMTDLLDNVMLYWFTESITTSVRIYAESHSNRDVEHILYRIPTPVPVWGLRLRHELIYQPDWLLKLKFPNFLGSTNLDEGGHFAAMEKPRILAEDIFKAVNEFNKAMNS